MEMCSRTLQHNGKFLIQSFDIGIIFPACKLLEDSLSQIVDRVFCMLCPPSVFPTHGDRLICNSRKRAVNDPRIIQGEITEDLTPHRYGLFRIDPVEEGGPVFSLEFDLMKQSFYVRGNIPFSCPFDDLKTGNDRQRLFNVIQFPALQVFCRKRNNIVNVPQIPLDLCFNAQLSSPPNRFNARQVLSPGTKKHSALS